LADGRHYGLYTERRRPSFLRLDSKFPAVLVDELDEVVLEEDTIHGNGDCFWVNDQAEAPVDVVREVLNKELGLGSELGRILFQYVNPVAREPLRTRPRVVLRGAAVCIQVPPIPPRGFARQLNFKRGPQVEGLAEYLYSRLRSKPPRTELRELVFLLAVGVLERWGARWLRAGIPGKYRNAVTDSELHGERLADRIRDLRRKLSPFLAAYRPLPRDYADSVQRLVLEGDHERVRSGTENRRFVEERLRGRDATPELLYDALGYPDLQDLAVRHWRLDFRGLRRAAELGLPGVWHHELTTDEERGDIFTAMLNGKARWVNDPDIWRDGRFSPEWRRRVLLEAPVYVAAEIIRVTEATDEELELVLDRFPRDVDVAFEVARGARSPDLLVKVAGGSALYRHPDGPDAVLGNRNSPAEAMQIVAARVAEEEAAAPPEDDDDLF